MNAASAEGETMLAAEQNRPDILKRREDWFDTQLNPALDALLVRCYAPRDSLFARKFSLL
jgi:hypothetical protein